VPASARGVFGSRLGMASAYADLLAGDGVVRGLIGPREAPRLWQRHLLNCAVLTELLPDGADVCDIGSGAGLPGLVLAIRRPDVQVTLVEPLLRRTTFLSEAVAHLGLTNVEVRRGRAEALHGVADFSVVTSRAVAPLPRLLDWSMPLVRQGGVLLAMKGSSATDEVAAARAELDAWRTRDVEVLSIGAGVIDPPTTVIRAVALGPSRLGLDTSGNGPGSASGRVRKRRGRQT
jgi:16S rRNA (guanine527-N7)-methyltransferase